jgi:hypothetical protein
MSSQHPIDPSITQLRRTDLALKRAVRSIDLILRRDLDLSAEMLARQQIEEGGR